jgi:transcriptional regulator with XRE-family HTH domain
MRKRLRTERKTRRWTTQQVADELGISRRMYVYIEQGARFPNPEVLNKLEDLFGMPQRELLVLDSSMSAEETESA